MKVGKHWHRVPERWSNFPEDIQNSTRQAPEQPDLIWPVSHRMPSTSQDVMGMRKYFPISEESLNYKRILALQPSALATV